MEGAVELAQNVFGTSAVRLGIPESLGGIEEDYRKPEFATVIGLVQAQKKLMNVPEKNSRKNFTKKSSDDNIFKRIFKQLF